MNKKYKYYYNGEPAVEYCKKHPEFKYNHLTRYVSVGLKKDPTKTEQELIDEFFNITHRKNNRYLINGMSLKKACEVEKISYTAISKEISRAKKNKKYENMSEDEIINMILEKYMLGEDFQEIEVTKTNKLILRLDTLNNK
jgi:hypothetical protein